MRIAPDLQEHTIQNSLGRFQADLAVHSSRLDELKQRVSTLEDENTSLQDVDEVGESKGSCPVVLWFICALALHSGCPSSTLLQILMDPWGF